MGDIFYTGYSNISLLGTVTDKTFHIYRSSAGSGKTRTLAKEYLKLALRFPEYFRYILAMTFTNKSTQEMKDRIIRYLDDFGHDRSLDLAAEIRQEIALDGKAFTDSGFRDRSREVLSLILHQYSQFAVSTIDAFFQRVIRSFTRETGLLGNFRLEVDNDLVLEEVIDRVLDKLTDDEELRGWVLEFSLERLEDGRDWDIRSSLLDFSREIFREEFKAIEEDVLRATEDKRFFNNLKQSLQKEVKQFEQHVLGEARALMQEFQSLQLVAADFKWGAAGSVYTYIAGLEAEIKPPGSRVRDALLSSAAWPGAKSPSKDVIIARAEQAWIPRLQALTDHIEQESVAYFSAEQVLRNLYAFGLLSDITKTLREYLRENNVMLLSDAPQFLQGVMQGQDTSFVYEKVGSFFRHFLVDEFQDTSGLQWSNVLPLVRNGIAQNYRSLLVGDIKQSIYRWRGGDLNILQERAREDIGILMTDIYHLDTNYRSATNIVQINNALFEASAAIVSRETGTAFPQQAYIDAAQKIFRQHPGYVNMRFFRQEEKAPGEENGGRFDFQSVSLEQLPGLVEDLQGRGVALRDIAFLVRDNSEGQAIAQYFMQYRASPQAKSTCKYDVVSNESLRLDQATCVLVLINALRLLDNPKNQIARAQLAFEYQKLWPTQAFPNYHRLFSDSKTKAFATQVPAAFAQQQDVLAALPLVELVETLIHIFNLGKLPTEIAYLQGFQDVILEFAEREKNDLASFLEWWNENKWKKSIQVAGGVDAAQIITIHKSKGLQFAYVIIPFLDWELNHPPMKSPVLWCRSDDAPFNGAGYFPLKYSSKLESTVFKEYYTEERKRIYLDNLNLLYVAFTRAEEGLIVHAPLTKSDKLTNVGRLTKLAIEQSEYLSGLWTEDTLSLQAGTITPPPQKSVTPDGGVMLRGYSVSPWRERLAVRTDGKEFFEETEKRRKINYGIFLHTLMSRVRTADDITAVAGQALREGLLAEDELELVADAMRWIVSSPVLQPAFAADATLKTEAALIMPDGSERRIDRVTLHDNKAFVVDYKTGKPKEDDRRQVQEYLQILQAMGVEDTTGFLVYVHEKRCEEVHA
ncbi:UvrD-helicase domain-containing protein [Fulvivirgaceae bacterium QH1ED-6-2]|nr:UvrD-helicase domain-containing protein [Parachryseolinea silvisoli]